MSSTTTSVSPSSTGRHQRKVRNLLLDKHFQLKYSAYLMAIAAVLGAGLGVVLWQTSGELVAQSRQAAAQGERIVQLGREVVDESRKVSAVVRMNIVKDPVYQDDPDLLAAFNSEAQKQDEKLDQQRASLEHQRSILAQQAVELDRFHRTMLVSLFLGLFVLVLCIGLAGVVVTHKVAGPIFKMKRHLRQVTAGELEVPWGLRKGDELVDFFDTFRSMVASLRSARESQIVTISETIESLEGQVDPARLAPLKKLRLELEKGL